MKQTNKQTACASTTKKMVGATVDSEEITQFEAGDPLTEEMRLSQNCGENLRIDRSAILTCFVPPLHPCSGWSNRIKPCFAPSEIEHALFLRAAIYPLASTHATRCEFDRTTKLQVFLRVVKASCSSSIYPHTPLYPPVLGGCQG